MGFQDTYGSSVVPTSPLKHHGNFILPNSGGGAGLTIDLSLYHSRRHPLSGKSGTCAPASRAPIKSQSGYKLGRKHTLRTSVTTGEWGEWQGLGELSIKSTPGANPSELLSFSFKRPLLGSQRASHWVLSVAHGSPEILSQLPSASASTCLLCIQVSRQAGRCYSGFHIYLGHNSLGQLCLPCGFPGSSAGEAWYQVAFWGLEDACGSLASAAA